MRYHALFVIFSSNVSSAALYGLKHLFSAYDQKVHNHKGCKIRKSLNDKHNTFKRHPRLVKT